LARRRADRHLRRVRPPRGTATALFFLAAFALVPLVLVATRGGANLHGRIQRYHALRFSIQSDDPGRLAIADPEADVEILAALLVPAPGRRERARALYDSWRRLASWEIYELAEQRVELAEDGQAATESYVLKASRGRARLHFECEDEWTKRDGTWYLLRQRADRIGSRLIAEPGPIRPEPVE
jgi:hypothetical protein